MKKKTKKWKKTKEEKIGIGIFLLLIVVPLVILILYVSFNLIKEYIEYKDLANSYETYIKENKELNDNFQIKYHKLADGRKIMELTNNNEKDVRVHYIVSGSGCSLDEEYIDIPSLNTAYRFVKQKYSSKNKVSNCKTSDFYLEPINDYIDLRDRVTIKEEDEIFIVNFDEKIIKNVRIGILFFDKDNKIVDYNERILFNSGEKDYIRYSWQKDYTEYKIMVSHVESVN